MSIMFLILAIISLSFSSVHSGRYPRGYWNSEQPPYDEVVNIANGEHKNNVFDIKSRMGEDYPRQGSSTMNVGNGRYNKNTFNFHSSEPDVPQFNDRGNTDRTTFVQSEPDIPQFNGRRNTGGTTFVHRTNNGEDVFNVGYGQNNRNEIKVNGKPIQDCYGDTCDVMSPRKASAGTNLQGVCLSLTFLSLLNLFIV